MCEPGFVTGHDKSLLAISREPLDEGAVVAMSGEIDLATAATAEQELRRAEQSRQLVALDLRKVSFMDAAGLHVVIDADRRMRAHRGSAGGHRRAIPGPPPVRARGRRRAPAADRRSGRSGSIQAEPRNTDRGPPRRFALRRLRGWGAGSDAAMSHYRFAHFRRQLLYHDMAFEGGPRPGEAFPDFALPTTDGGHVRKADGLQSRRPLLMYFASIT